MWLKKIQIKKVSARGTKKTNDQLLIEKKSNIYLNNTLITKLYHTPKNEHELALGYCYIHHQLDPENIHIKQEKNNIYITGPTKDISPLTKEALKFHDTTVFKLTAKFQENAYLFKQTAISESAAISSQNDILFFAEDINQWQAIYKVIGHCIKEKKLTLNNKCLLISSKIDEPLVSACYKINIFNIISRTAATALAYDKAIEYGMKLIGFARGTKYSIYT
ncbi:hypothetical protein DID76_02935 [Candidatus Marinamargulisbacteria bacterium SCGC AG-414-C22]|nr:hypothetical protein DID76_02935 [Candidatus Marinamargulisbacteria bacterium SCGC AG-414-C22]